MNTVALQSGMTPGVCPYTRTQSASSDTPESAQLIRRIEELRAENRQLTTGNQQLVQKLEETKKELAETKQQVRVKDELIFELIKRPPEQTTSPAKTNKKTKRRRATQKDIENRNRVIAGGVIEITDTYGRLPSVSEVMQKTALTQQQIYASPSYKAGKIARASAKVADDMTGRSIQKSEFYGERSQEHGRRKNQSKAKRAEVDVLVDQQTVDDNSRFVTI